MTKAEIAKLLLMAAAFDQRTIGDADIEAWAATVGDLRFGDARSGLITHYREETTRIMPAHVLERVAEIREARLREAGTIPIPEHLADYPIAELEWRDAATRAVADGLPLPPAPSEAELRARTVREIGE